MKKFRKAVLVLSLLLCAAGAFSACGESNKSLGIQSAYLNDSGELIIVLTDGTQNNLGKVQGTDGPNGTNGKSAYELYCAAHPEYEGTETEWLRALLNGTLVENTHRHEYTAEETGALCDTSGYTTYSCTCGEYYTVRHSMRHMVVNGVCVYCGNGWDELDLSYLDIFGGTYGYRALGGTEHGEEKQKLYAAIDKQVRIFHEDASRSAEEAKGNFVAAKVNFSDFGLNYDEAAAVWATYRNDNPLYYWLTNSIFYNESELELCTVEEFATGAKRAQTNRKIYKAIDEYTKAASKESSDYQTALCYHDSIICAIDYAYEEDGRTPQSAHWAHSILGVFTGQGAVCEGYARSFQLLLNVSGVENVFVTGTGESEAHAWNLVRLDNGGWYWCDLTWDDTPAYTFGFQHRYFCVNDTENINLWDDGETYPERSFLYTHTPDSSETSGAHYLYELPARAETPHGTVYLRSTFTAGDCTYAITGYRSVQLVYADAEEVTVPETVSYKGKTYEVLSVGGMDENKRFGSIFEEAISEEVKRISIPASVRFIYECSFYAFGRLESIEVAEGNAVYTSKDGVLYTKSLYTLIQYPPFKTDTVFTVPDETYYIAHHAFERLEYLETFVIGKSLCAEGITIWGDGNYPDGENTSGTVQVISTIGGGWHSIVSAMKNFKSITVDPENPYYCVSDGILYDKEFTAIWVAFPEVREIVMPDTVYYVASWAFLQHAALERVVLSANLDRFLDGAFLYCYKLKSVTVPAGFTKFGGKMFAHCSNLEEIHYGGTVEEWRELIANSPQDWNTGTGNYFVYCTDGIVKKGGAVIYYE